MSYSRYDDDHKLHSLMKVPYRLLFGLALGVALGYGLTLLARPAPSRRIRRRPRPASEPRGAAEQESGR